MTQLALAYPGKGISQDYFTSEDGKLEAAQTGEGIHKSELSSDQKSVLL